MKPVVDCDLCIGCGLCEDICPEIFQLRDDGMAWVIDDSPSPELYESARDAAASCPVEAIGLQE
jgi:ferredoxin